MKRKRWQVLITGGVYEDVQRPFTTKRAAQRWLTRYNRLTPRERGRGRVAVLLPR